MDQQWDQRNIILTQLFIVVFPPNAATIIADDSSFVEPSIASYKNICSAYNQHELNNQLIPSTEFLRSKANHCGEENKSNEQR